MPFRKLTRALKILSFSKSSAWTCMSTIKKRGWALERLTALTTPRRYRLTCCKGKDAQKKYTLNCSLHLQGKSETSIYLTRNTQPWEVLKRLLSLFLNIQLTALETKSKHQVCFYRPSSVIGILPKPVSTGGPL